MENFIQGVLQYSRAGRGDPTLVFCKLKEIIDGIWGSLVVPEEFSIQIESDIVGVYADQTQIIQVFTNLISNAIKHNNNPQGRIKITARECGKNKEWVEILVSDNGPGIPMQYHEKGFQVFQTLQPRDKAENTGVGLAIVKKIIEKQGGKIEILDLDTIGTTFKITLEFLQEIRKDPRLKSLSVFALTTSDEERDKIAAYNFNIAGYILKPIEYGQSLETIKTLDAYWTLYEFQNR